MSSKPVSHASLLEIPGAGLGQGNKFIGFQIDQAQCSRIIFGWQPVFDGCLKNGDISLVRTPGVDTVITGKQMLFWARCNGNRVGNIREVYLQAFLG